MKKIFYLFCIAILCFAVYSCETPQDEKCWHITIGVDMIDIEEGLSTDTFTFVMENYRWLSESQVEKEADNIISELLEEFRGDDETIIVITSKTWELSKYETSMSCKAIDDVTNWR